MNNENKEELPVHCRYAPSSASRWTECTKSIELPQKPYETNEFAELGTACHSRAEAMLKGKEPKTKYKNVELGEEEIQIVDEYVAYIQEIEADLHFYEKRVFVTNTTYGTVDALLFNTETGVLHVCDLKAGKNVYVSNKKNKQLMVYAIGAVNFLKAEGYKIKKIFTHIIQPYLNNISKEEIEMGELKMLRKVVLQVIKDVDSGNTKFAPSEDNCRWCNVVACPKLFETAQQACQQDFLNFDLSEKMKMVPQLKAFIKNTEEEVYKVLDVGEDVAGFCLKPGRGKRIWRDKDVAAQKLLEAFDGDDDLVYEDVKLLTPAKIEKLVKKQKVDIDLDELIQKLPGALKIVEE